MQRLTQTVTNVCNSNFLGEGTTAANWLTLQLTEYLLLMDLMHARKVHGCVSVKPTQLGLTIDYKMCLQNFSRLAARAREFGQFIWLDMESVKSTEDTIAIYLDLYKQYDKIGIAVQSYLRRSQATFYTLLNGPKVRSSRRYQNQRTLFVTMKTSCQLFEVMRCSLRAQYFAIAIRTRL